VDPGAFSGDNSSLSQNFVQRWGALPICSLELPLKMTANDCQYTDGHDTDTVIYQFNYIHEQKLLQPITATRGKHMFTSS